MRLITKVFGTCILSIGLVAGAFAVVINAPSSASSCTASQGTGLIGWFYTDNVQGRVRQGKKDVSGATIQIWDESVKPHKLVGEGESGSGGTYDIDTSMSSCGTTPLTIIITIPTGIAGTTPDTWSGSVVL